MLLRKSPVHGDPRVSGLPKPALLASRGSSQHCHQTEQSQQTIACNSACKPFPHLRLGGQTSKRNCKRSSARLHGPQRIISARLSTQLFRSGYPQMGTLFLSISDDFVSEAHWQIKEKRGSYISIFPDFPCLCLFY